MTMTLKCEKASSLQDEIENCPNIKADIKVTDESPFLSDYSEISEEDKPFIDRQMNG